MRVRVCSLLVDVGGLRVRRLLQARGEALRRREAVGANRLVVDVVDDRRRAVAALGLDRARGEWRA
jgi:hypothetical protein